MKDLNDVNSLFKEFFSKREIRKRLNLFNSEYVWSGIEKWWQLEFDYWTKFSKREWKILREQQLYIDQRTNNFRYYAFTDMVLRKKGWRTDQVVCLEMKSIWYASQCIKGLVGDWRKYLDVTGKSAESHRELFCIGLHRVKEKEDIKNYINRYCEEFDIDIRYRSNQFITEKIGNTGLSLTIF